MSIVKRVENGSSLAHLLGLSDMWRVTHPVTLLHESTQSNESKIYIYLHTFFVSSIQLALRKWQHFVWGDHVESGCLQLDPRLIHTK